MPSHLQSHAQALDERLYEVIAQPVGPPFDRALSVLTNAADHSKLSITQAGLLALFGGRRGRRAAATGLAAVALTSALANGIAKPLARRRRPNRLSQHLAHPPDTPHHVPMPESHSFPSGHSAAAFAFATGVGRVWPAAAVIPTAVALAVGYSRVHAGVHYPGDVALGWAMGITVAVGVAKVARGVLTDADAPAD